MSEKALQIHQQFSSHWMSLSGVEAVGVGQFEGLACIRIFASVISPELKQAIPDSIEGVPIRLERTEPFSQR